MQTWIDAVPLLKAGYHQESLAKVEQIRRTRTVYPPPDRVFYALEKTPFPDVQVVLVGQDPYHGLAFSVLRPSRPGGFFLAAATFPRPTPTR